VLTNFWTGALFWGADVTRRLLALTAMIALSGCALDQQTTPPLSGPSEFALSLAIQAKPDVISQDGQSQAQIEITALDASSQPVRGLALRAETMVDGVPADFGVLSSKTVSTGNDGRAVLTYRAPMAAPSQASDLILTVVVVPVGTDYSNAVARTVDIRLARPGVIQPPNGTPVADFFFSPVAPREGDDVFFDGSSSFDNDGQIVSYRWTFGDGRSDTTSSPTTRHSYDLVGSYNVMLTVTDDRGLSASKGPVEVKIASASDPVASFVFSPSSPKVNTGVNFNASASKATAGRTIVEYFWDFGDGSPHHSSSNSTVLHTFDRTGNFTVVLRVMDDTGRFNVTTQNVTIAP
jgi:PKD repeat protein